MDERELVFYKLLQGIMPFSGSDVGFQSDNYKKSGRGKTTAAFNFGLSLNLSSE